MLIVKNSPQSIFFTLAPLLMLWTNIRYVEYGAIARLINHFGASYLAVHFTEFPEMLEDKTGRSYKTISFLTSSEMQIQDNIF